MKKLIVAIIGIPMFLFGAYGETASNDDEVLGWVSVFLKNPSPNALYAIDGRVINLSGKSIYKSFPRNTTTLSMTTYSLPMPEGIYMYVNSLDDFPERIKLLNPKIYKVRQVLARKLIGLTEYGCDLDKKSIRLSKGFVIEVHVIFNMVGKDPLLFLVLLRTGRRGFYPITEMSPAMFKAQRPTTILVSYDSECKISDDSTETDWVVNIDTVKNRERFYGYIKKDSSIGRKISLILSDGEEHKLNVIIKYPMEGYSKYDVNIVDFKILENNSKKEN